MYMYIILVVKCTCGMIAWSENAGNIRWSLNSYPKGMYVRMYLSQWAGIMNMPRVYCLVSRIP